MLKLDEALTRLDGDRELYCQLAREFCARCPSYAASLEHAVDGGHWDVAILMLQELRAWCSRLGAEHMVTSPPGEDPDAVRLAAQEMSLLLPVLARETEAVRWG